MWSYPVSSISFRRSEHSKVWLRLDVKNFPDSISHILTSREIFTNFASLILRGIIICINIHEKILQHWNEAAILLSPWSLIWGNQGQSWGLIFWINNKYRSLSVSSLPTETKHFLSPLEKKFSFSKFICRANCWKNVTNTFLKLRQSLS